MHRIIITILLAVLLMPAQIIMAQQNNSDPAASDAPPRHSLGGSVSPVALGITWKARPTRTFAIETDLVLQAGYNIFLATPHGELHCPPSEDGPAGSVEIKDLALLSPYVNVLFLYNSCRIGKHFDWYIGGGPRFGFIELYHYSAGFYGGVSLSAGFEWHSFKKPLDIAFDLRPFFGFHPESIDLLPNRQPSVIGLFDCPITVSFRRRF